MKLSASKLSMPKLGLLLLAAAMVLWPGTAGTANWWRHRYNGPSGNNSVTIRRSAANVPRPANNPYAAQYNPRLGPIRYNQWGQPQWPYSQRTSGVTQLGPAPAAAGVRSLPGWGGER